MFPHHPGLVWYRNTRVFRYHTGLVWYPNTRAFRYHSDNFDFDARSLLLQTAIAPPCFCVLVCWVTVFTCIDVCETFVCERFGFRISLACFPRAGIFKKRFAVPKAQPLCRRHSPLLPRLSQRRRNCNFDDRCCPDCHNAGEIVMDKATTRIPRPWQTNTCRGQAGPTYPSGLLRSCRPSGDNQKM